MQYEWVPESYNSATGKWDSSASSHSLTRINGAYWDASGMIFDGTNDYLAMTHQLNVNQTTWSFAIWLNLTSNGTIMSTGSDDSGDHGTFQLVINDSRNLAINRSWQVSYGTFGNAVIPTGVDTLLVISRNGNNYTGYMDNSLMGTITAANVTWKNPRHFGINWDFSERFHGKMYSMGFWDYELTSSERTSIYNTGKFTFPHSVAPVINLNGASTITIEVGSTWSDPVSATDNVDASVTVNTTGSVNTSIAGEYTLTYNATDTDGNTAVTKTRTVSVLPNGLATLQLLASNKYRLATFPDIGDNVSQKKTKVKDNLKLFFQAHRNTISARKVMLAAGQSLPGYTTRYFPNKPLHLIDTFNKKTFTSTDIPVGEPFFMAPEINEEIILYTLTQGVTVKITETSSGVFTVVRNNGVTDGPIQTKYTDDVVVIDGLIVTLGTIQGVVDNTGSAPICFLAGTPIQTNQGKIPIEKLNPKIHTIRGKTIQAITKTITPDDSLICFEPNSLGNNLPSQKTVISMNHKIFYQGKMTKAKYFTGNTGIYKIPYKQETLYNVLLETHDKMVVNNMICETLDPRNTIAQLYMSLKKIPEEKHASVFSQYNAFCKEHNIYGTDSSRPKSKGAAFRPKL